MICYDAYHTLQNIREALDIKLKNELLSKEILEKYAHWRGAGTPSGGDILYGSITATTPEKETIVGLQEKFLFMLQVLQSADARPTPQAVSAIEKLEEALKVLTSKTF
jgi:hypothetical protein